MERLEHDTKLAIEWFENNCIKINEEKFYLLAAGHRTRIWESKNEKLLGLTLERNLNFDDHVYTLCKKVGRKLSALSRISNYMSFQKIKRNSFKSICGITVWALPINLDVL